MTRERTNLVAAVRSAWDKNEEILVCNSSLPPLTLLVCYQLGIRGDEEDEEGEGDELWIAEPTAKVSCKSNAVVLLAFDV